MRTGDLCSHDSRLTSPTEGEGDLNVDPGYVPAWCIPATRLSTSRTLLLTPLRISAFCIRSDVEAMAYVSLTSAQ